MDPATAGAVMGAGGIIGGYMNNQANAKMQAETNAFNAAEAQKNRDYQTQMSNTAHQREMADMRAAGLNPMLSAKMGASTPSGSTASGTAPKNEDIVMKGISSAIEGARAQKDLKLADGTLQLQAAQKTQADTQAAANISSAKKADVEAARSQTENEALRSQMGAIKARATADKKAAEWDSKASDFDAVNKRLNTAANSARNIVDAITPRFKFNLEKGMSENEALERAGSKGIPSNNRYRKR